MKFLVQIDVGCWLAPWSEDLCGRTLVKAHAKQYGSSGAAIRALKKAREYRPFKNAMIEKLEEEVA